MADNQQVLDISREFSCFLCNGYITLLGSITMETNSLRLAAANG